MKLTLSFILLCTVSITFAQNPEEPVVLPAVQDPDGMIDLIVAPGEKFDGRIFFINDWDGGDKDNQNTGEELNRDPKIKEDIVILSHIPGRKPKKVKVDDLVLDAKVLADASKKGKIAIAMGAHSRHTHAWLTKLPESEYDYENIVIVTHSNWNELDGRRGYEKNKKPGDPPLEDTHGLDLRRGLYHSLARISDLGVTILEIPRTDMGPGGWGGKIATSGGDTRIKAFDISDLGLVHYLKTGVVEATRQQRNQFVSPIQKKPVTLETKEKPNVVIFFADDISARELPIYGSSVWADPMRENTSSPGYRAKTPVLDKLGKKGCWITTAWAATVCNPSRAMMMSGRYAHHTKWWNNKDKGHGPDENGNTNGTWPVYMSSPVLLGHAAQEMGYGTFWAGKTQMAGSYEKHGFDEGCFTPGGLQEKDNPYTDFKHEYKKIDGERRLINVDTGEPCDTYMQHGWYWYPHVKLLNHPSAPGEFAWWPNTPEAKKSFGLTSYGPDVELEFVFDFMERKHEEGKPFFIYHTTHLGHDAFNWFDPDDESSWPGTPKIEWDGKKYTRQEPRVTGDKGVYNTHNSITESGIHTHVNYIDYQVWQYLQKFKEMSVDDNTVFVFTADNGTAGYGKNKGVQQRGCHVPLIIYAPGMTKHGEQDILVSLADILPTVADLIGYSFPEDYELDGISLVPYLFGNKEEHRQWLYTYRGPEQLVRGNRLLKDGNDNWWDITNNPEDLTSYMELKNWQDAPELHQNERLELIKVLPRYDFYYDAYNAPGVVYEPANRPGYGRKNKEQKEY